MLKLVVIFNQVIKQFICLRNECWNFSLPIPGKVDTQSYLAQNTAYRLQQSQHLALNKLFKVFS